MKGSRTQRRSTLLVSLLTVLWHSGATLASSSSSDPVSMGTTLVALKFEDGVVVAADTRTSASGYVSNKFARKINVITDHCVLCRSGSAADTQWLAREATREFLARKWRFSQVVASISQVSHFLRYKIRENNSKSGQALQASLICAGVDGEGPHIFGIAPGGSMWEEEMFCVSGSGSTYVLGLLDSLKLKATDMYSKDQAVELITKLLLLSMARDGSSGGIVRVMILTSEGIQEKTIYPETSNLRSSTASGDDSQDLAGFAPPIQ
jgi:20S proteasome subunit beta 1